MILTENGVLKLMQRIKSFIASQLNTKAASVHTHTLSEIDDLSNLSMGGGVYSKSEVNTLLTGKADTSHTHTKSQITDFPTIPTKTSDLTNDSCIPLSGTTAITGTGFFKSTSDSQLQIGSGTSTTTGGCFVAYGSEYSNTDLAGSFRLRARTTSNYDLIGYADGTLTWGTKNLAMSEDVVPRSGGAVLTGISLAHANATEAQHYCGGTSTNTGGHFTAFGKDHNTSGGWAAMRANNGTEDCAVNLHPDGTMTKTKGSSTKNFAMQEDVIPRSGGAVISGAEWFKTANNSYYRFGGGTNALDGAWISVCGAAWSDAGNVVLSPNNSIRMYLYPNGTWTWSGTACQITSDQRLKQQITKIDDKLLDAWEDVDLVQFKYNDAVDQKGNTARLHTGYVVQQIDTACKSHNVDISDYGLYCHEEYPEETEKVEVEQEDGTKTKETKVIREASEHYSLRYTEVYAVECAYLRRENARLKQQMQQYTESLSKLEERLKALEQPSK